MADAAYLPELTDARMTQVASQYLLEKKQWKPTSFHLHFKGLTPDGRYAVIWAVMPDAEADLAPGGGEDVALYIDRKSQRVIKEASFQ